MTVWRAGSLSGLHVAGPAPSVLITALLDIGRCSSGGAFLQAPSCTRKIARRQSATSAETTSVFFKGDQPAVSCKKAVLDYGARS